MVLNVLVVDELILMVGAIILQAVQLSTADLHVNLSFFERRFVMRNRVFLQMFFIIVFVLYFAESFASETSNEDSKPVKLEVSFVDSIWDGKKVPKGQQCKRFGGKNPETPRLMIKNIPPGTNAIIMEFSDESYPPMDDGGHGKIGYRIPENTKEIIIPSVLGHSFKLPEGFFIVSPHQAPDWDQAGAYMPPCSGGRGNSYYVTVKAVYQSSNEDMEFKLMGQAVLQLGTY
jgi:hypothetical protein